MGDKGYSLLRIFTDENAVSGDRPLYEAILGHAKAHKLLGVTVLRGLVGFGHTSLVHASSFLDHNYPMIIEIVDEDRPLREFAAEIREMKGIGVLALMPVELL